VINAKAEQAIDVSSPDGTTIPTDIVSYLTAATLTVSGPAITADNKQTIKSLCRPLEVPK
jgi:hypothetical protein